MNISDFSHVNDLTQLFVDECLFSWAINLESIMVSFLKFDMMTWWRIAWQSRVFDISEYDI